MVAARWITRTEPRGRALRGPQGTGSCSSLPQGLSLSHRHSEVCVCITPCIQLRPRPSRCRHSGAGPGRPRAGSQRPRTGRSRWWAGVSGMGGDRGGMGKSGQGSSMGPREPPPPRQVSTQRVGRSRWGRSAGRAGRGLLRDQGSPPPSQRPVGGGGAGRGLPQDQGSPHPHPSQHPVDGQEQVGGGGTGRGLPPDQERPLPPRGSVPSWWVGAARSRASGANRGGRGLPRGQGRPLGRKRPAGGQEQLGEELGGGGISQGPPSSSPPPPAEGQLWADPFAWSITGRAPLNKPRGRAPTVKPRNDLGAPSASPARGRGLAPTRRSHLPKAVPLPAGE